MCYCVIMVLKNACHFQVAVNNYAEISTLTTCIEQIIIIFTISHTWTVLLFDSSVCSHALSDSSVMNSSNALDSITGTSALII